VDPSRKRVAATPKQQNNLIEGSEPILGVTEKGSIVGTIASSFENGAPPSPRLIRDPKRKKTTEDGSVTDTTNNGTLAGSFEGRRQAQ
jgi:hypothetical protein